MQPLPEFCPLTMGKCSLPKSEILLRIKSKPFAFIMMPYMERYFNTWYDIKAILKNKKITKMKIKVVCAANERKTGSSYCKICELIWFSDFGIAELGNLNPNVFLEIGLMWGFKKPIIFTINKEFTKIRDVPFDLINFMYVTYSYSIELQRKLKDKLKYLIFMLNKQ